MRLPGYNNNIFRKDENNLFTHVRVLWYLKTVLNHLYVNIKRFNCFP